MELKAIGVMGLNDAKVFQKKLQEVGVELVLNHNEASCTRGCAVTVDLLAKEADIPKVQELYAREFQKSLEGHDINLEQLAAVFDPSAKTVQCPACGFEFEPQNNECPDCGLMF